MNPALYCLACNKRNDTGRGKFCDGECEAVYRLRQMDRAPELTPEQAKKFRDLVMAEMAEAIGKDMEHLFVSPILPKPK